MIPDYRLRLKTRFIYIVDTVGKCSSLVLLCGVVIVAAAVFLYCLSPVIHGVVSFI